MTPKAQCLQKEGTVNTNMLLHGEHEPQDASHP